ncbi:MAG: threonine synthase [Bauldia sp.]
MQYLSTRGRAPALGFSDVLLSGLARDGGLFVPATWPEMNPAAIAGLAGRPYADVAFEVIRPFVGGDISDADLSRICASAYAGFGHEAVAPLVQLAPGRWVLELFHGPTLAFKDIAMQLLARLIDHVLAKRGRRVTIVGATSGDTGAAAIEAFGGHDNADVFILFPQGRVSPIQQRQMTTAGAPNVHAIAIKGTFDDCQTIVKGLFNDAGFRQRVGLAGVNSINWARILGQIVYYFSAAVALGAPGRPVSFTVPTGNFGDIFAGYAAKRMGLPVDRLVVATNVNDILVRAITGGEYRPGAVSATASPSMDIQVSSNFERLLFEVYDRDGATVDGLMGGLASAGGFAVSAGARRRIAADFDAGRADEAETAAEIGATYAATGFLADPHTAVGLAVARRFSRPEVPMICLATAHPAKFPAVVRAAANVEPVAPPRLAGLGNQRERFTVVANDRQAVADHIVQRTRARRESVMS